MYTPIQRGAALTSAILGFALDGYTLLTVSFIELATSKALHTSVAGLGIVFSLQLIFSMVGGVLFGNYADLLGRRRLLFLSITVYAVGSLLSAFSWNVLSLAIFRSVVGIGLGAEWGVGMALYNEVWTKKSRAFGGGIIQGSFIFGIMFAGIVSHWALTTYAINGWRIALATGFLSLVPIILTRLALPESQLWQKAAKARATSARNKNAAPISEVFHRPSLKFTVIGLIMVACYMYSFYAVTAVMPTIMTTVYKLPTAMSSTMTTWATLIGGLTYFAVGLVGDITGRKTAFLVGQALSVVGFGLFLAFMVVSHAPAAPTVLGFPIFWAYLLFYMGSASFAVFGVWFSELYPTRSRSTGISLVYMIGRGTSALAPIVATRSMRAGLITGTIAAVALFVLPWVLRETRGVNLEDDVGIVVDTPEHAG